MTMSTLHTNHRAPSSNTNEDDARTKLTYRRIGFALMLLSSVIALTGYFYVISAIVKWLE